MIEDELKKNDLIVIAGAGGFIGGSGQVFSKPGLHKDPRSRQEAAPGNVHRVAGVESLNLD